jgi:uncharacterized protein (TIGR03437 family)
MLSIIQFCRTSALAFLSVSAGMAQAIQPITLQVDTANWVSYEGDVFDYSKFATSTAPVPAYALRRAFGTFIAVADIVNINGKPARGTLVFRTTRLAMSPAPLPGDPIADVTRGTVTEWLFELLQTDGTQIGSFVGQGLANGAPPPGAPRGSTGHAIAITGGTGPFVGAKGQITQAAVPFTLPASGATRRASVLEDPSMRRINGGINSGFFIQFIPMVQPAILTSGSAVAVVHASDNSLVTAAKPARAGELLTLYATGLGPTKTLMNPGEPFPSSPLAVVNSPVDVMAGGAASEVLYSGGVPDTTDRYQVNFRLPSGVTPGNVTLQLVTAYIPGPAVTVPVQ